MVGRAGEAILADQLLAITSGLAQGQPCITSHTSLPE